MFYPFCCVQINICPLILKLSLKIGLIVTVNHDAFSVAPSITNTNVQNVLVHCFSSKDSSLPYAFSSLSWCQQWCWRVESNHEPWDNEMIQQLAYTSQLTMPSFKIRAVKLHIWLVL
jgi:hypothetical protein